jgi:hypothetical protein
MYTRELSSKLSSAVRSRNFSACPQAFSSARILLSLAGASGELWAAPHGTASRIKRKPFFIKFLGCDVVDEPAHRDLVPSVYELWVIRETATRVAIFQKKKK